MSMIRPFVAAAALLVASAGWASGAIEVNTADRSQLESIKGVGPSIAARILAERKRGEFKDWGDLEARVPGIGDRKSAALSAAGLTVAGQSKGPPPEQPVGKP